MHEDPDGVEEPKEALRKIWCTCDPADREIVQYVAVARSPRTPRWVEVAFSCGPLAPGDDFPHGGASAPAVVAVAREAMKALVADRAWTLVYATPAFGVEPPTVTPGETVVTWWIHK